MQLHLVSMLKKKNKFKYLKKDQKYVDERDRFIKVDSERSFSLYKVYKKIEFAKKYYLENKTIL